MKTVKFFTFLVLFFCAILSIAQESPSYDKLTIGVGGGLDYGGLGGNVSFYPTRSVGFFAGAGYAFAGLGLNGGVKLRILPKNPEKKVIPFGLLMYGYNAAIVVSNDSQYDKMFYGASAGLGIDFRPKPVGKGYWSFALLLPFRSSEVDDYIDDLKNNHGVEFKNNLFPVGFSIGYKFIIN